MFSPKRMTDFGLRVWLVFGVIAALENLFTFFPFFFFFFTTRFTHLKKEQKFHFISSGVHVQVASCARDVAHCLQQMRKSEILNPFGIISIL